MLNRLLAFIEKTVIVLKSKVFKDVSYVFVIYFIIGTDQSSMILLALFKKQNEIIWFCKITSHGSFFRIHKITSIKHYLKF